MVDVKRITQWPRIVVQTSGQDADAFQLLCHSHFVPLCPPPVSIKGAGMTSFPLIVEVTPNSLQLKPGASAELSVKITNVSDIVAALPGDDRRVAVERLLEH